MTKKILAATLLSLAFFTSAKAENYKVGTTLDSAPYLFADAEGLPVGFDADIIKAIAKDQGFEYDIITKNFDSLFTDLNEKRIDLAIANISMTPERQEKYAFTDVYITDYRSILYLDPKNAVNKFSDLIPLRVAALDGSIDYNLLTGAGGKPLAVKSNFIGLKRLVQGKVDVIVGDENSMRNFIKDHPDTGVKLLRLEIDSNNPANPMGIVVKKGNNDLLNKLNKGLENIRKSGEYDEIVKKWF